MTSFEELAIDFLVFASRSALALIGASVAIVAVGETMRYLTP